MSEAKRLKTTKVQASNDACAIRLLTGAQTIGTHNGTFHCDEALAVYLLRQTSAFKGAGT